MRVLDDGGDGDNVILAAIVTNEALERLREIAHALPTLQYLNVSATQLRNLNVSHNAIASLQELASLTHLRILNCSYNAITDLRWLTVLHALQELYVQHNCIERAQLAHLQSLQQLATLVLHPNPCTTHASYTADVVRTLPWLERLDTLVVDDALRNEAQNTSARALLASGASDCTLPLLTARSDSASLLPSTPACLSMTSSDASINLQRIQQPVVEPLAPVHTKKKKKTKQEIAEEFMRNFPVQDYIPTRKEQSNQQASTRNANEVTTQASSASRDNNDDKRSTVSFANKLIAAKPLRVLAAAVKTTAAKTTTTAAKQQTQKLKQSKRDSSTRCELPCAPTFQQDELIVTYPHSSGNAVHVRTDGSALAKWPNGSIAVSIDREHDGFRAYAAHRDGSVALSLDAAGVGFINYYPSGRTMLSTTARGDGLVMSSDGATIVRQWDASRHVRDEQLQPTHGLGSEPDGALVCKLSDGIAVRVQLAAQCKAAAANPIQLTVFFATTCRIRYAFANSVNVVGAKGASSDACDCVFGPLASAIGSNATKRKSIGGAKPAPPTSHGDLLHDIRAAVAGL